MNVMFRMFYKYLLVVLLLVLWWIWGLNAGSTPSLAPRLQGVIDSAYGLIVHEKLWLALLISLRRIVQGFAIALVLALIIGIFMAISRKVERNLDPVIQSIRHVAPISIVPLAILWLGSGSPAAIFVIVFASFFPLLLNVIIGIKTINPIYIRAALTMGVGKWNLFKNVMIPAALPSILNGARISIGVAWTSVIAAELAVSAKAGSGSSGGVGQMMFTYFAYEIRTEKLVVCMIGIGIIALVIDYLFRWIQRRWTSWATRSS